MKGEIIVLILVIVGAVISAGCLGGEVKTGAPKVAEGIGPYTLIEAPLSDSLLMSITDNTPDLNFTTSEVENVTYSWDGEGNISGCRNCNSFNTTYGESVPETNTSLLFHLNENLGDTAFDDSGSNDALLGNGTSGQKPSWTAGRFGRGLKFDGDNDYVNIPYDSSLDVLDGDKPFTLGMWFKVDKLPSAQGLAYSILQQTDGGGSGRFWLYIVQDTASCGSADEISSLLGNTPLCSGVQAETGIWYFTVLSYNGTDLKIYVNGTEKNSTSVSVDENATGEYHIGTNKGASLYWFNGTIDEIQILDRVLSPSEIADVYSKSLADGQHNVTVYNGGNATRHFTVNANYARDVYRTRAYEGFNLYRGDIHGHSLYSDGDESADFYFTGGRDSANQTRPLDFVALTDHCDSNRKGINKYLSQNWTLYKNVSNYYNRQGYFTLLGWENSGWSMPANWNQGHSNVYVRGNDSELLCYRDYLTKQDLWDRLAEKRISALTIPHHPANNKPATKPGNFSVVNTTYERLFEIYSKQGTGEYLNNAKPPLAATSGGNHYYQFTLDNKHKMGIIAASDTHRSLPGTNTTPSRIGNYNDNGMAAVWSSSMQTREDLFDALYNRTTYGTDGEDLLMFFDVNGNLMGADYDEWNSTRLLTISAYAPAGTTIDNITILKGTYDIQNVTAIDIKDIADDFANYTYVDTDTNATTAFYYVRAVTTEGYRAWASPIWSSPFNTIFKAIDNIAYSNGAVYYNQSPVEDDEVNMTVVPASNNVFVKVWNWTADYKEWDMGTITFESSPEGNNGDSIIVVQCDHPANTNINEVNNGDSIIVVQCDHPANTNINVVAADGWSNTVLSDSSGCIRFMYKGAC